MPLPVIPVSDPVVVPAVNTPQMTFDHYHLISLSISSDPNGKTTAEAILQKACTINGVETILSDTPVYVRIADVFLQAQTDATLAQLMGGILQYVTAIGQAQGVL